MCFEKRVVYLDYFANIPQILSLVIKFIEIDLNGITTVVHMYNTRQIITLKTSKHYQ